MQGKHKRANKQADTMPTIINHTYRQTTRREKYSSRERSFKLSKQKLMVEKIVCVWQMNKN